MVLAADNQDGGPVTVQGMPAGTTRYIDASPEADAAELADTVPEGGRMAARRKSSPPCASGHTELFRATLLSVSGQRRWALTKLTCDNEAHNYRQLTSEPGLRPFLPELFAVAAVDERARAETGAKKAKAADVVVTIEDLTAQCHAPCVMDVKMGARRRCCAAARLLARPRARAPARAPARPPLTRARERSAPGMAARAGSRTYLESETGNGEPRQDLLRKLLEFAPREATPDERAHGVSKRRYMRIRDCYSTSYSHGYRVDGVHLCPHRQPNEDAPALPPNPRAVRRDAQLDRVLGAYLDALPPPTGERLRAAFAARLCALRDALRSSDWFRRHECVSSSLLFVYDGASEEAALATADVRWIDFTNVVEADADVDHRTAEWSPGTGSREDGFLWGLDNLVAKLSEAPAAELGSFLMDRATEPA